MTINNNLLDWLFSLQKDELNNETSVTKVSYPELADGYLCAKVLNKISPSHFDKEWLQEIKSVPANGDWSIRYRNLENIIIKIRAFIEKKNLFQLTRLDIIKPNASAIAQNFDPHQINRLVQHVLCCAILCDKKKDYIDGITQLKKEVQLDIKDAITEILESDQQSPESASKLARPSHLGDGSVNSFNNISNSTNRQTYIPSPTRSIRPTIRRDSNQLSSYISQRRFDSRLESQEIDELKAKLNDATKTIEEKAQLCHDLELKLKQSHLEKDQLQIEIEKMSTERSYNNKTTTSSQKNTSSNYIESETYVENLHKIDIEAAYLDLRSKNEQLQVELLKYKENLIRSDTDRETWRQKADFYADEVRTLLDKNRDLKHKADKSMRLQDELDEMRDTSEKIQSYELKIDVLQKRYDELRRENKTLDELNKANSEKIKILEDRLLKYSSNLAQVNIYKKQLFEIQQNYGLEAHRAEKAELELSRLTEELNVMREEYEKLSQTTKHLFRNPVSCDKNEELTQSSSVVPNAYDNSASLVGRLLTDSNNRAADFELENRKLKKQLKMIHAKSKEQDNQMAFDLNNLDISSESSNVELVNRIDELQRLLFQREQELVERELKYKRNIHKAKEIIRGLDSK